MLISVAYGTGRAQPAALMEGGGEGRPPLPVAGAARHPIWRAKPAIWGGVVTLTGRGGRSPSPLWRTKPAIWGGVVTLTGRGRAKPAPGRKGGRSLPSHMAGEARYMGWCSDPDGSGAGAARPPYGGRSPPYGVV